MIRTGICEIRTKEDVDRCVALQDEVWGPEMDASEDAESLIETRSRGGILLGAFDSEVGLAGFVVSYQIEIGGDLIQHSHLLAVRESFRDRGYGYRLKKAQWEAALRRKNSLIVWTFDPLESRNGHLNLNKLGAVCFRYYVDLYGETCSILHQGLATDRLLVEWSVSDGGITLPSRIAPIETARVLLTKETRVGSRAPEGLRSNLTYPEVFIEVPYDIQRLKREDLVLAERWRGATREAFLTYLRDGYTVQGLSLTRQTTPPRVFYVLRKNPPNQPPLQRINCKTIPFSEEPRQEA